MSTDFDRWVNEHSPADSVEHGAAFSDYVQIVRRIAQKFDAEAARVAGTYAVTTPPPEQQLVLPIAVLEMARATLALRWDFGAWPNEWIVSVERSLPYRGPTLGLFDPRRDVRAARPSGLEGLLFPPLAESPSRFTCELYDEWDVATLTRLVAWEE